MSAVGLPTDISNEDMDQWIAVAHQLAEAAGAVARPLFRSPALRVEDKADASPVTVADRTAEQAMRDILAQECPTHSVFGEEGGLRRADGAEEPGDFVWVLDPIDGTKSFITGKPLFGTLIALTYKGEPILGVIDQCILKERWVGAVDRATTLNGNDITTRATTSELGDAYLYATTPLMFEGQNEVAFQALASRVKVPMYGCDCYAYGLLAAGFCDIVCEADLKPYDYMALVPIVEGANGTMTDWRGNRLRLARDGSSGAGEVLAAATEELHARALAALQSGLNNP